jgi:hypothetical protein
VGILSLRACSWRANYRGGAGPELLRSGAIRGPRSTLDPDRAVLPSGLEIPASSGATEIGRFVLTPDPSVAVSLEERRTAATLVGLLARHAVAQATAGR